MKNSQIASTFIFCVYLPADGNEQNYTEVLAELQTLASHNITQGNIVIAGNLNAQYIIHGSHISNSKSKPLTDFIDHNSLVSVNVSDMCDGPKYSFIPSKSMIDYILVDTTSLELCHSCQIIDESSMTLTSDHYPICLKLEFESSCKTHSNAFASVVSKCVQWHKATTETIEKYSEALSSRMEQSGLYIPPLSVNKLADSITECLGAATAALPLKPFNKYAKPYWTREVKSAHEVSRSGLKHWLAKGKPRGPQHQSYTNYKNAKASFCSIQRHESEKYLDKFSDLDEASGLDYRLFWQLLKKLQNKLNQCCIRLQVDGKDYNSPSEVANGFSKYFENIIIDTSPSDAGKTIEQTAFVKYIQAEVCNIARNKNNSCSSLEREVMPDEVFYAIKLLKTRKAPGWDGIQNEHIFHGGHNLIYCICKLFNSILVREIIPDSWKTSIIVPIYKAKGKLKTDPNNYRPVSLLPAMCKLFAKVLMERINTFFQRLPKTFPCPQQQGFQKSLSCLTTAFNLQETIYYNLDLHSNVYVAFLDIHKAFDSVWHDGLLFKLDKSGINGKIWHIIKDSYTNIRCRVSINGLLSDVIKMTRGIRQGGVTSTGFYLVFADGLLSELEASGLGATVCSVRSGNPGFVDDLALIATSPAMLQKLFDIVNLYMLKWLIRIHTDKSCILIFSNNKQIQVCNMFHIGNDPIRQETSANYLGILQDTTLKSMKRTLNGYKMVAIHFMLWLAMESNHLE